MKKSKKIHQQFQFGWTIILMLIPIHLFFTSAMVNKWGDPPISLNGYLILSGIFIICLLLFYCLSIRVDKESILISFGIGIIRKKIAINAIKSVEIVKNPWYYGVGIKIIPKGWPYSIHGFSAVELRFKDSEKIIRIGCKNCHELKREIEKKLAK